MSLASERRRFLACLSDPSRFRLVTMLAGGPRCVTELAVLVGLSQSCTTRHLQALLREAIVVAERHGKRVVYALRDEGREAHPVLKWACESSSVVSAATSEPNSSPRRSRRQSPPAGASDIDSRVADFEPENTRTSIAVEHEGGWLEADTRPGDDSSTEHSPSTLTDGPSRSRAEMDDFLL